MAWSIYAADGTGARRIGEPSYPSMFVARQAAAELRLGLRQGEWVEYRGPDGQRIRALRLLRRSRLAAAP